MLNLVDRTGEENAEPGMVGPQRGPGSRMPNFAWHSLAPFGILGQVEEAVSTFLVRVL